MNTDNNIRQTIYKRREELIALGLLIPLVLILAAILKHQPEPVIENRPAATAAANIFTPTPNSRTKEAAVKNTKNTPANTIPFSIQSSDNTKTYRVEIKGETTVEKIMRRAETQGLEIVTENYGKELGLFVQSINGLTNNPNKKMYWYLYVNDKSSPVGASAAKVAPGDSVTWRYEKEHTNN